jgi:Methyltransferase domain
MTLSTIMRKLGHADRSVSLEILKLDVEGAEWSTLVPLLEQGDFPFARQVLIELHPTEVNQTRHFFNLMHKAGYRISHKEVRFSSVSPAFPVSSSSPVQSLARLHCSNSTRIFDSAFLF